MVRGDNCKLLCGLPKARQTKSRTATSSEFSWNFVPLNIVKPYISIKMNKRGKKISRQFYIDKFRKPGTTWAQNIERSEPKHSKIVIKRHQILISLCGIGKQLFNVTSALRCIRQYLQNSFFFINQPHWYLAAVLREIKKLQRRVMVNSSQKSVVMKLKNKN